jgi:hypothetical protein
MGATVNSRNRRGTQAPPVHSLDAQYRPVVGSRSGKPRCSNSTRHASKSGSDMPSRCATGLGGTSPRSGMRAGRLILRFQKSAYGVLCGRVRRGLVPNLFSAAAPGAISTKERLQHVWYQCCGFDGFVEPTVLGRVRIELFLERLQQDNGEPHRVLPGQWTKFQINHGSYLPIKASASASRVFQPCQAARTRSRLMITRTGNPGRTVRVGWMLRLRCVIC